MNRFKILFKFNSIYLIKLLITIIKLYTILILINWNYVLKWLLLLI